jgi:hypothetical protein
MASKGVGIGLIEKYEKMVQGDFAGLEARLTARTDGIKELVTKQVRIDLGVYDLYAEKAALKKRLQEVRQSLKDVEDKSWDRATGNYVSPIEQEVKRRLDFANAPLHEVRRTKESLIRQIQLSGVGAEIKDVFTALPKVLSELQERFGDLPPLTENELKQIPMQPQVEAR